MIWVLWFLWLCHSKKPHDKISKVSKVRDEYRVKWEEAYESGEDWSTSTKKAFEEMCGLPDQAFDAILQLTKNHEALLDVELKCSDFPKDQVTDLTGHLMKSEKLLCTCCWKERMALKETKRLNAQRCNLQYISTYQNFTWLFSFYSNPSPSSDRSAYQNDFKNRWQEELVENRCRLWAR